LSPQNSIYVLENNTRQCVHEQADTDVGRYPEATEGAGVRTMIFAGTIFAASRDFRRASKAPTPLLSAPQHKNSAWMGAGVSLGGLGGRPGGGGVNRDGKRKKNFLERLYKHWLRIFPGGFALACFRGMNKKEKFSVGGYVYMQKFFQR